jgi:DNA repair ATPase RecN
MLTKLKIKNFQKHHSLSIEFDNVTTIIGTNGAGKSSIIRALDFVFNNQPRGTSFITHGETECEVKAKLDDRVIKRVRGKVNEYYLDDKKFAAFGYEVPEEIKNFININELNIQKQLDSALWFHLSPLEISRKLNKIVNLDLIDLVLKNVAEQLYAANHTIKHTDSQITQTQKFLDENKWVLDAEEKVNEVREKQRQLREAKQQQNDIKDLNRRIVELLQKIKKVPDIDFQSLDNKIAELQIAKQQLFAIDSMIKAWKKTEDGLDSASEALIESEAELKNLQQLECPLCGK